MKLSKGSSIAIIDYGMGNVSSVQNALKRLGYDAQITNDHKELDHASGYILPGVGAFGLAMKNLNDLGLVDVLNYQVIDREKPILGICLGMQLLADSSTEMGCHKGLGWIPGSVELIDSKGLALQVPHVGWNNNFYAKEPELFRRIPSGAHFYFDHSYHFICDGEYVVSTVDYGASMVSAVRRENVFGVQFHPEKSQVTGLKLLRNYLNYVSDPLRSEKC